MDDRSHRVTFDLRNCGGYRCETHKGNRLRTRAMLLHVLPDAVFPHSAGVNVVFRKRELLGTRPRLIHKPSVPEHQVWMDAAGELRNEHSRLSVNARR